MGLAVPSLDGRQLCAERPELSVPQADNRPRIRWRTARGSRAAATVNSKRDPCQQCRRSQCLGHHDPSLRLRATFVIKTSVNRPATPRNSCYHRLLSAAVTGSAADLGASPAQTSVHHACAGRKQPLVRPHHLIKAEDGVRSGRAGDLRQVRSIDPTGRPVSECAGAGRLDWPEILDCERWCARVDLDGTRARSESRRRSNDGCLSRSGRAARPRCERQLDDETHSSFLPRAVHPHRNSKHDTNGVADSPEPTTRPAGAECPDEEIRPVRSRRVRLEPPGSAESCGGRGRVINVRVFSCRQ